MNRGVKVRLKVDLTKYKPGLVAGTEGTTIGNHDIWSRGSDRFIGVHFPEKGTLDVLWESLDIIDEEDLKKPEQENLQLEELKSATEVVKFVGPRGGFRYLSYTYTDSNGIQVHISNGFRKDAEKLIDFFNRNKIKVVIKTVE